MVTEWMIPAEAIEAAATLLRETGTPGAAIALAVDDDPIVSRGIGVADLAGALPMAADGRFLLYSVTKTILAIAALRLVEAGEFDLDADVSRLLPDVPLTASATLRQLLNHTGGLPDYGGLQAYAAALRADPGAPWPDAEFLERTLARGPRFAPCEWWAYSNIGYLLVRRIVEARGGGSLARVLDDLIFRPLGLRNTSVAASLANTRSLTPGYSAQLDDDGELRDVRDRYHPGWVSHGVVESTAAETAAIVTALFDGRLLGPAALAEMLHGVAVGVEHPAFAVPGYGLGLMLDLAPDAGLVAGHAGGGPGYSTAAFRFETLDGRRVTSVALANRDAGEIGLRIAFAVAISALAAPG
jgi:D-alanyl-D-alanine carboxypeptidase